MPAREGSGDRIYLHVERGRLVQKLANGEKLFHCAWEATLVAINLYEDAAPGYEKKVKVRLVLAEGTQAVFIQSSAATLFGRMLAGYLTDPRIQRGCILKVSVAPGEKETVNFCHIEFCPQAGAPWQKPEYNRFESNAEATAFLRSLPYYEAYAPPTEESVHHQPTSEGDDKERRLARKAFIAACTAAGWPMFELNPVPYLVWANRAFKAHFEHANELTAVHFDAMRQTIEQREKWPTPDWRPKSLIGIADDYDPFAE